MEASRIGIEGDMRWNGSTVRGQMRLPVLAGITRALSRSNS